MSKINWRVRLRNKTFWMLMVPAMVMLVQSIGEVFGFTLDLSEVEAKLVDVVEAIFIVLACIGIVTDPTTAGFSDSEQALTYDSPKAEHLEYEEK